MVLTRPNRERGEADHIWPELLPNGQGVLFTITSTTGQIDNAQVAVLDLRTGVQKVLVRGGSHAHYVSSGHLVYGVTGTLRAVAFDVERLNVVGSPVTVLSQIVTTTAGAANFDIARDGTLVYVAGGVQTGTRTLVWVDREDREERLKAPPRHYVYPRLSPDGTRIALDIRDQDNDIWIWDIARETLTRMTTEPALDRFPVWMPDGRRLLFCSDRGGGVSNLFWQVADGTGAPDRLIQSPTFQCPRAVSSDGSRLVFAEQVTLEKPRDLIMVTLDREQRVQPLIQTPFSDDNATISPDARWLAYNSDESGQHEVYVRPFPDVNNGHWQVSNGGGVQPLWARNGQELFYRALSGTLMSVQVSRGYRWTGDTPVQVVKAGYLLGNLGAAPTYDVSVDGRRFLMIKGVRESDQAQTASPSIIVVQNWFEELKRRVPTK